MNVRRSAAVVAVLAATATAALGTGLGLGLAPAALADDTASEASTAPSASPSQAIPTGLYGSTDPTYDGVWRQSLTLLALRTVGEKPGAGAVEWLVGQQCASGAFPAYRADATAKCDAATAVDTNSTAAAIQALAAVGGRDAEAGRAVRWLKDNQNQDGGWGYTAGGPSDANSTSVVIGALAAVGDTPGKRKKDGNSPYDALRSLALPCGDDGASKDGGAFAYQPDKKGGLAANADATAAAVLGSLGKGFVVEAGRGGAGKDAASFDTCASGGSPEALAHNGAVHLAGALTADGYLKSSLAGAKDQPDHGNTADAVVALAAAGDVDATAKPLAWLEKNYGVWAAKAGPAAYAQLVLAAHASGADPRDFGGADLVAQLRETGPAGDVDDYSSVPVDDTAAGDEADGSGDGLPAGAWWVIGLGLIVAAALVGFALMRGGRKRPEA
ncbi:terpene cyclase/mutase family protein [Streptomyces caniscabiei]|uniref:prenyltransferase/squalene oxidase repeat-containing protein n=1 Tax=Streptomyces caniscabiei TaxID=2746961 RepID=UPI0029B50D14|nr:prenyltransferase/squalene oxidase repeat-containing protein [Streptomyces caniscabiei]MDX2598970.1 terpene cyclase/mutase family protein [Streptomyces caniscabiei]MDX2736440.1 terpene cyclase/mutase family protein [Streptomyces caniscabiei]MDX2784567.1 terpene cyclase/mutase family protein [Streptomyces caniscabiei]